MLVVKDEQGVKSRPGAIEELMKAWRPAQKRKEHEVFRWVIEECLDPLNFEEVELSPYITFQSLITADIFKLAHHSSKLLCQLETSRSLKSPASV